MMHIIEYSLVPGDMPIHDWGPGIQSWFPKKGWRSETKGRCVTPLFEVKLSRLRHWVLRRVKLLGTADGTYFLYVQTVCKKDNYCNVGLMHFDERKEGELSPEIGAALRLPGKGRSWVDIVENYNKAIEGSKACWDEFLKQRGLKPFAITPVAPLGIRLSTAFLDYADGTGSFQQIGVPHYPESPQGRDLRMLRVACDLNLREAATLLNVPTVVDMSGLETGSRTFVNPEDWKRAEDKLLSNAKPIQNVTRVEIIQGPAGQVESWLGRQRYTLVGRDLAFGGNLLTVPEQAEVQLNGQKVGEVLYGDGKAEARITRPL